MRDRHQSYEFVTVNRPLPGNHERGAITDQVSTPGFIPDKLASMLCMAELFPTYSCSIAASGETGKQVFDRLHRLPDTLATFDVLLAQCFFQDHPVVIPMPLRLTGMACSAGHFCLWRTRKVQVPEHRQIQRPGVNRTGSKCRRHKQQTNE